ncbi:MAG: hypothetical protein ABSE20_06145 [Acetobacteraceae bacterium]|jgi:hypothetical protein
MRDADEFSSWIESRRLIISQLATMEAAIRDLGSKIDKFNDSAREKAIEVAKEAQSGISELNLRVAMLELRAKLWGGVIGLAAGGVGTVVVQLIMRALQR